MQAVTQTAPRDAWEKNTDKPLVSVIIIFLNEERFIREAIESVFAQTYENWKLLLVDDGSTDASTKIARRYAEQYPERVRYLEHDGHQNRGMSASRNLGIRHAKGKYIGFLDADDFWLPEKLAEQTTILSLYPDAAMVCGPVEWWYSWTGDPDDKARNHVVAPAVQIDTLVQPPKLVTSILKTETVTTTSSLLRRDAIETLGGFEDSFYGLYEDQVFCAKLSTQLPVFVAGKCWYRWRKHPDSSCAVAVQTGNYGDARLTFLQWLKKYLAEQNIEDTEVWKVLRRELWKCQHPNLSGHVRRSWRPEEWFKNLAKRTLPIPVQRWFRTRWYGRDHVPPLGCVDFGSLRRTAPVSRVFGFDRGVPIDRYYIEQLLAKHASEIRGRVLEIGDNTYTRKFGAGRVLQADVLHVVEGNPQATMVADLTDGASLPSDSFDCIICTQTLMFIYDVRAAISTLHRILKSGGVLLVTVAGVSHQISRYDVERWGDYWRFTSLSMRRLLEEVFPPASILVETYGNVMTAMALLQGLAVADLSGTELDAHDPDYEVTIGIKAVKPQI